MRDLGAIDVPEGQTGVFETRELTVSRDGAKRLDGVSLRLAPGGVTAVMGPNGAGKSLLLSALHGLISPCAGAALWGGAPIDLAARRAQAMVFQRPAPLRRSVSGNLDYVLKTVGRLPRAARRARIAQILAQIDLADRAGAAARALSGGEQQRLALGCALALAPKALLLDEPTASLDPAATARIEALIAEAERAGVKVVLVTHDAGQARRLADDVVFLSEGRLCEHAPAQTFFAAPRSEAAAAHLEGRLPARAPVADPPAENEERTHAPLDV